MTDGAVPDTGAAAERAAGQGSGPAAERGSGRAGERGSGRAAGRRSRRKAGQGSGRAAGQEPGPRAGERRRRAVVALTLVLGVAMLTGTLHLEPGNRTFVLGAVVMATIWALGARACGPLPWRAPGPVGRQFLPGALAGGGALALCLVVGIWVAGVPALAQPAQELLAHRSTLPFATVVAITGLNGVAEELYFRGALYDALPPRSAWLWSAVTYALASLPSGVALLTAGAALLGLVTGQLRRRTGGLLAPITAHLVWSIGMLLLLPSVLS